MLNCGGDVELRCCCVPVIHSVLQSLYESIKTEPFKIPEDDGNDLMHTFFNPDKEGWLWKQGEFHLEDTEVWTHCFP
jgi:hypothetical protein